MKDKGFIKNSGSLDQQGVSDKTGIDKGTVSRIFNRKIAKLSKNTAEALAVVVFKVGLHADTLEGASDLRQQEIKDAIEALFKDIPGSKKEGFKKIVLTAHHALKRK